NSDRASRGCYCEGPALVSKIDRAGPKQFTPLRAYPAAAGGESSITGTISMVDPVRDSPPAGL
ncbi:MAG: hypothetical protein ACRDT8_25715, partial [Micromonosporaceae bacterium]